jgi:hypothetical protein
MSSAVDSKTSQLSRAEEAVRSGRQQVQRLELRLGQLRSQKAQARVTKVRAGWCGRAVLGGGGGAGVERHACCSCWLLHWTGMIAGAGRWVRWPPAGRPCSLNSAQPPPPLAPANTPPTRHAPRRRWWRA